MNRRFVASVPIKQLVCALAICCGSLLARGSVLAADTTSDAVDYPLVIINAASFQRLRDNAGVMFESVDRADMEDRVDQWTAGTLKETKGIDRTRPFGMMLYMRFESITPLGISYLPVTNLDEALETLAYGTGTISPVEGTTDRHEIQYSESFKLRTLYQNGYLFLVGPDGNDSSLDRKFPDPEKMTARLTSQYDLAISVPIKSIPPGLKTTFLAFFTTQSKANLQQRDDEPESVYRLRRANGEGWIDLIEKVVNQGNEITLGAKIDPAEKVAYIDFEIAGSRDSKLAKLFQNMTGKRTYFGNLLTNPATFTMSVSWLLEEKQRKLFVTYFDAALRDLSKKSNKTVDEPSAFAKIVEPIFKTFMTTADVGHLDAVAQLTGSEEGQFAFVAGVKLATAQDTPAQVTDILQYLKDHSQSDQWMAKLDLDFDAIDSHAVHRLPINPPDKAGQRLFGEEANLYLYASPQAVWCAFGGESALGTLRDSVQTAALPQGVAQNRNRLPFQFVTHAKNWLSIDDENNPNAISFNEKAQASFESDNDAMTIEIRPTENGVRIRTVFESGFIELLGRGISGGIENGFFNRPRRAGQENQRGGRNRPDADPAPPQN